MDHDARGGQFQAERPRLVALATRVLDDHAEAEDVVQQAWLRLHRADTAADATAGAGIDNLAAWLTTVTTRLCLDRLRSRTPTPRDPHDLVEPAGATDLPVHDPAGEAVRAEDVGTALGVVLDRLSPRERVAFVLHDSFGHDFPTVAQLLDTTPGAARKLASRARAKLAPPAPGALLADHQVVDAFMAAARGGELDRLLRLLAPDAVVTADRAAVVVGTPDRIEGPAAVAAFFDGSARSALAVHLDDRPGYAWYDRGTPRVVFDFTVVGETVQAIVFRADPDVLARVGRRRAVASHPAAAARRTGSGSAPGPPEEDPR